jgi:hypothetical protein
LLELIRARSGDSVYYIRNMERSRMSVMHTKLIRRKCGIFWNVLQVAGVHQGQVREPGVLHQVHGVVQDGIKLK